ncbi:MULTISPECIES: cytochrome P450 [Actinomycetes]|uniref:cytochrome P450 n=1 Tax=Actinomycetes TaxID=1760 RepID=UPI000AAAAF87|nr:MULTISPECIES: cytochrome P450 [Actinomycetes]
MSECPVYNPFSELVLANPFPAYAEMQQKCPVHRFGQHEPPFYTAFKYADVVEVVMNRNDWTARYGISPQFQRGVGFNTDGSEHVKFRRAVVTGLTKRHIDALEPDITRMVKELLDGLEAHGPGDFHDLFAMPLPVAVIAQLMGIEGELGRFKQLSDDLMIQGMNSTDVGGFHRVRAKLDEYWQEQLAPRKALLATVPDPKSDSIGSVIPDDLITTLLLFRGDDGQPLTDAEIHNSLMNLLLAGNETTTSLLTNLIWRLLEVPSRWEELLADRSLVDSAIEESLRFDSPVLGMFRTSLHDVELGGVEIGPKSKIMVNYGAANRDPDIFSDADQFLIDRPRDELRQHIAFGKGPHVCPGAELSRLETRVALNALLDRFPALKLNGGNSRIEPFNFWGRRTLPVSW